MLDTAKYVKKLVGVGYSSEQAETQIEAMTEFIVANFASKEDLKDFRVAMEQRFMGADQKFMSVHHRIDRLEEAMQRMKLELIIIMGSMMLTGSGLTVAILEYVKK